MVLPIEFLGIEGGEATLYRLLQEALSNAVKHNEGAQRVDSRGWRELYAILFAWNDGRELDSSQVRATHGRKGLGLVAIEERMTAIVGTLEIESRSRHGTELSIRLPLEGGHANSNCAR
jgi:signal transduction histidine kinase